MDTIDTFYQNLLKPFLTWKTDVGNLQRYFLKHFKSTNHDLTILMEYESSNKQGLNRPWVGVYYGILHSGIGKGLSPCELEFVEKYYYESFWKIHHPGESFCNIFLPGFEDSKNENDEHWDFWIRVRENSINEVPVAIKVLEEAVKLLNL